ncbi:hypothetical protein H1230_13395 [Paenibacillus sp. 19GGS1-52]|uniref:DUF2577 domain-containing protein n=1 Tax=Paenibacillus sp. 19GGS1-52 TaxID=2758563 RepID=UPI001EFBD352|nr:DUF2577 domain-containing protein [Paenibacillus sp. 19GGS1-52]ULO09675.1 hypothetical protein H1230_13395 [Paenibacillus sp. 19GGS1-52]
MNDNEVRFTKYFKDRDNKTPEEIAVAKVITIMPNIKLSLGLDIILDADDLVIASRIYDLILHIGDDVIVTPSASGQLYYLIDKVGAPHVS